MKPRLNHGFSLIELIVVIAIIALLIGILLPVISRIRESGRSTVCLANVQQWGAAYHMYLASNRASAMSEPRADSDLAWWERLAPYIGDPRPLLVCPDAREPLPGLMRPDGTPRFESRGSAAAAWRSAVVPLTRDTAVRKYIGSYGFNVWVYHHPFPNMKKLYIQLPTKYASNVPLLGDCVTAWALPTDGDAVPENLINPFQGGGVGNYCLDRHQLAVNLVFLDGHAEHIPLQRLWQLKWSENSIPRDVQLPAQ